MRANHALDPRRVLAGDTEQRSAPCSQARVQFWRENQLLCRVVRRKRRHVHQLPLDRRCLGREIFAAAALLAARARRCTLWFRKRLQVCISHAWSWRIARTLKACRMGRYPVQRHKLPSSASAIWASDGCGDARSSAYIDMTMPGVQNPHCDPCACARRSCTGCGLRACPMPSTVTTAASALRMSRRPRSHARHRGPRTAAAGTRLRPGARCAATWR